MRAIACVLGLAVLTGCAGGWAPSDPGFGAAAGYGAPGYETDSQRMMEMAAGMMSGPTAQAGFAKGLLLQQHLPIPADPAPMQPMPMPSLFPQTTTCMGMGPNMMNCTTQ